MDRLKAELGRKCQVCHSQSQEIQQLRERLKDAELLSMENESLAVGTHRNLFVFSRVQISHER